MCHLSMKLSATFDQNSMHTSDKIVVKHILVEEILLKLEQKGQGHGQKAEDNNLGNKNIPPLNKVSRDSLSNWQCLRYLLATSPMAINWAIKISFW